MNHEFEYVMSGCSYSRMTYPTVLESETLQRTIGGYYSHLNQDHHKFSLLYNAFAERLYPRSFKLFKGDIYKIHADSGGLQLITRGSEITPAIKNEIYTNQAKNCDIAMSFDEIPLITTGGKSKRGDMSSRFFDIDNYKEKALKSAHNLIDQIELFKKLGSQAQPMLIVHGNTFQNANEWVDIILDTIPAEDHKFLGGIAMGGGSFGMGEKEMVLRTAVACSIFDRHKHLPRYVHFLGIGSVRLFFATFFLKKSGWMKDISVSYDSTTHSSAPHMGRYIGPGATNEEYTRRRDASYDYILADIKRNFPQYPFNIDQMFECLNTAAGKYKEKNGTDAPLIETYVAFVSSCIKNFKLEVDKCSADTGYFLNRYVDQSMWGKYATFGEIRSSADYLKWDAELGNVFDSKRIGHKPTALSGFFD